MHQDVVTRRSFLRLGASAAAATVAVTVLGAGTASAQTATVPTFALDPTGGGSSCRGGTGNGTCAACNACRRHAANKVFRSKGAADKLRAHTACRCTIVAGPALSPPVADAVFGGSDSADRRDAKTAELLAQGTIDGAEVPVMAGTAPVLLLAGGGFGYWLWRRRHREPAVEVDHGDWK